MAKRQVEERESGHNEGLLSQDTQEGQKSRRGNLISGHTALSSNKGRGWGPGSGGGGTLSI